MGEIQSYGLKTGKEALIGYDADGNKISEMVKGDKHGVGGKKADKVMSESFITIHNHPSSASFSDNDIHSFVSSPNAKHMVVVGHDGTIYKLSKPDNYSQKISFDEVTSRWSVSEQTLNPEYMRRVVLKRENKNMVWRDHTHRIVEDLSSQLGLKYERVEH